jgi:alkaline phosphatase D
MDSRSERLPSTREEQNATYISEEQLEWLQQGLLASTAHFKVLMNSVPITNLPPLWLSQDDRWQGYFAQRVRLVDHILINDIRNVWFITGDFHLGFIARVEPEGEGRRLWEIAAGPGANGPNPLAIAGEAGGAVEESIFPANQFEFWSSNITVATTLTFDPVADNVAIKFVDSLSGEVLYDDVVSERD